MLKWVLKNIELKKIYFEQPIKSVENKNFLVSRNCLTREKFISIPRWKLTIEENNFQGLFFYTKYKLFGNAESKNFFLYSLHY